MRRRGDAEYILGSGAQERERLASQGDVLRSCTEHFLHEAGIRPGMRVLDVGCGLADASILLARAVAPHGSVVAIDRDPAMIEAARARVAALGGGGIRFLQGDFRRLLGPGECFDAAFGRLVLIYQSDPADAVSAVAEHVAPGGVIAFQEYDSTIPAASLGPLPLHVQVRYWIWEAMRRSGVDVHIGMRLYSVFLEAGLPPPEIRVAGLAITPSMETPSVQTLRSLLPKLIEYGIASEEQVGIDTLEARLREERRKRNEIYIGQYLFGAYTRRPG
jgi:SAM-dependent methyltransferase